MFYLCHSIFIPKPLEIETIYILAIESSCDDTSAAILRNTTVLSNVVASQKIHEEYGGVVPELASRAHQQNIVPVVNQALAKANIDKKQLSAIAFTRGPGLMGSLLAHFIQDTDMTPPKFPFLALTISGGHTQILKVSDYFKMEVLGQTLDDAVGEAFDKSAKVLGLPYPGGPLVDKYAQKGNPRAFEFPIPKVKDLDFSFSGLKTSILYFVQRKTKENPDFITENLADICASIQYTIVTILMRKLKKSVKQTEIKTIAIGGGVSANSGVRKALVGAEKDLGWTVHIPKFEYCTDNAAMIGIVGYLKFKKGLFAEQNVTAKARYTF
jgi:N6-L-threonylcarbamoyladenine synthase